MLSEGRSFSSKIMLFGEYSIIQQSHALSFPYELFSGKLLFRSREENEERVCHAELISFAHYLKDLLLRREDLGFSLDLNSFLFDIAQGLVFSSSIPQGYGVGSSGALVAAIFERYGTLKSSPPDLHPLSIELILHLRDILAAMEAHFHGKSSGIDPVISYLNHPLLIRGPKDWGLVKLPTFPKERESQGAIFLLDTGQPRKTGPLVQLFLEKCQERTFLESCLEKFIPLTNDCITQFLAGNWKDLLPTFLQLSLFQWEFLTPMIPPSFAKIWEKGLHHGDYLLKLCGAGGGGFLLGITGNFQKTCEQLSPIPLRLVFPL